MTLKQAQIVRTHTQYGAEAGTHIVVEIFEVLGPGLRRRVDVYDLTFEGATEDGALMTQAVQTRLVEAGLLAAGEQVLTEAEARVAAAGSARR